MSPVIPPPPKPPDGGNGLIAKTTYIFRYVDYVHRLTVWNKKWNSSYEKS